MIFIDSNIFIRFFVKDDTEKSIKTEKLFRDIVGGKLKCITSAMVIAEIVWVLEKFYKIDKESVCDNIELILNTPNIKVAEKDIVLDAVKAYRYYSVDFIDSYNYSYLKSHNSSSILSYDAHFDKIASLKRIEP